MTLDIMLVWLMVVQLIKQGRKYPIIKRNMKRRSLFEKRVNLKPYEYPELLEFKDAISHSYWLWSEYNYTSDIQDYKTGLSELEKNVITKSMLSISQIEVTVKRFWSNLYNYFPKPEIDMVGVSFGESEVRHLEAYAKLLELLGMNDLFDNLPKFKPLMDRVNYIEDFMRTKDKDPQGFVLSMVLFSLFIEHISLFGQFYTIQSFNKRKNKFKGISNVISATFLEEDIHGKFGIELYRILRVEHPEIFTDEFYSDIVVLAKKGYKAEMKILDWIFEDGDLGFLTKDEVKAFVTDRYNKSLEILGIDLSFPIKNPELLKETTWFTVEQLAGKENDFFNKRSTDYSKKQKQITADDLF